ncbi:type II secretion system F family protein [Patescibacteria group bacterium]|nr:type II secretion system F family protein [Patescibacteria group bacterium]MBU1970452.1 type II secretion system F family protein [Patescibacteria group bacterium]
MTHSSVRLSSGEKIEFISNLHTMLKAGIPILNGVESLLDDSKGNVKKVLTALREDLLAGRRVYVTLAKFPETFDKVTINLVRAAEEAGTLETSLADIKKNTQAEMEFADKVKSALTYPAFVFMIFIGVMGVMLFVVMPKISQVFSRLKVDIPLPTRILLATSAFVVKNTLSVGVGFLLVFLILFLLYQRQRKLLTGLLLRLPIISGLYKKIDIVRFSRSLGLLLSSGIPIVDALELSVEVVNRHDLQKLLAESKKMVYAGKRFSEGLKAANGIMPNIVVKLIELGEASGSLDRAMADVTEYMDYDVSRNLKTLTTLLEPVMLVLVGGLVGGIMMSIISPMYSMIGQVSAR